MKNAVKPLTIISMILIAVGIISAAILIIFQNNNLMIELTNRPDFGGVFVLPYTFIISAFIRILYSIIVFGTMKECDSLLSNIISIVIFALFLLSRNGIFTMIETTLIARKSTDYLAAFATLNSWLIIPEFFFRAAFILLLIAAVIAQCVKKNEE